MGHWSRQYGTITLPRAEFAGVRKILQESETARKESLLKTAQEFWDRATPAQRRDERTFSNAAVDHLGRNRPGGRISGRLTPEEQATLQAIAPYNAKPSRLLRSHIDWPTSRTLRFGYGDLTIVMDREKVTLEFLLDEEKAYYGEYELARTLFQHLDTVDWTRSSGGMLYTQNELNVEETDGQHRASWFWGPAGVAAHRTLSGWDGACE